MPWIFLLLRRCKGEGVCDAALGQGDLEGVLALRLRAMQGCLGGLAEKLFVRSLAMQNPLCLERAPGPGAYTTQGDSDVIEFAAVDHGHDRRGGEGKFIGSTVTQLEVYLLAAGFGRWERH